MLHELALREFDTRVRAVPADGWHRPTPCTDWDVRALVNHIVVEQLWVPPLFEGRTIEEVGDRFDGDQLGENPVLAWENAAKPARAVIAAPGALERIVHLSFGDVPGRVYVEQLTFDLAIHAWDLARGIGADERLDPRVAAQLLPVAQAQVPDFQASGMFAPPLDVAPDTDPQTRLLALTGRRR